MKVKKNNKALNWKRLVSVLCCIVVFCTTYALILPAVTLSKDTYCGKEAHTHDAECYREHDKSKPLCGLEEGETSEGHVHDASCYQTQEVGRTLICGLEEDGEHVHSDDCYETQVETVLVCGKEEGSGATEGHVHNDDCYISETPIYGQEEHEHSHECYSNKEDVEDPKDWEEAYKDISKEEDAKTRILTVAKNEVGYKENEANFSVDENDKEHYYTRYGHLYEDMYGDWNNYFTGYVLKYANVKMNFDKDINKWISKTSNDQIKDWEKAEEGNVVFFKGEDDKRKTAIVTTIDLDNKKVKAIQGDVDGAVKEVEIAEDKVLGFLSDEVKIEEEITPLAGDTDEEKIEYTWEDEDTYIRVITDPDTFKKKDVRLEVRKLDPESEEFQEAMALVNDPTAENQFAWDISFMSNKKEIEPEKPIQIILTFKDSEQNFWLDTKTTEIIHIKELEDGNKIPEAVDQTIKEEEQDGYIDSHVFNVDSLSVIAATLSTREGEILTPTSHIQVEKQFYGLEDPKNNLSDFKVTVGTQEFTLNSSPVTPIPDGMTGNWIWRTKPLNGGTYSISESGLEAEGYHLSKVLINGKEITVNETNGVITVPETSVDLKDPDIIIDALGWNTAQGNTLKKWSIAENDSANKLVILTINHTPNAVVISKSPIPLGVQKELSVAIEKVSGNDVAVKRDFVVFYSIPEKDWNNDTNFEIPLNDNTKTSIHWIPSEQMVEFTKKGGSDWNRYMANVGYKVIGNISDIVIENHYQKDVIDFSLLKTEKNQMSTENPKVLADAEFALKTANDESGNNFTDYLTFKTNENGIDTTSVKGTDGNVAELKIEIGQLYQLIETTPPAGYITVSEPLVFKVIVGEDGNYKIVGSNGQQLNSQEYYKLSIDSDSILHIVVGNDPGQALPNTGGAGTKLFTFSGAAVIAASGLMYGYKKKKDKRNGKGGLRK